MRVYASGAGSITMINAPLVHFPQYQHGRLKRVKAMMTLDEAIAHAEEVANASCDECSKEHKQLAEWLKELKRYKENPEN